MMFSAEYPKALNLILPSRRSLQIILAGCGGTGSWLAPSIARIGRLLEDRGIETDIRFVDPDRVEEKNIYRQNFCQAEIGIDKAEALAMRYSAAWGVSITSVNRAIDTFTWDYSALSVICGCVDNAAARRSIKDLVKTNRNVWWLDCGNSQSSGQVLIGRDWVVDDDMPFRLDGFCGWLPSPALQCPDLVESRPNPPLFQSGRNLSCAEMALRDSQGLAINQRIAAEAADYLVRMLITKDLRKYATYIDLESGSCRSDYITRERIEAWMKRAASLDR